MNTSATADASRTSSTARRPKHSMPTTALAHARALFVPRINMPTKPANAVARSHALIEFSLDRIGRLASATAVRLKHVPLMKCE
jgi:hypothetical protein